MATHSYSLQWADHQTILTNAVLSCSPDVTLVCGDVHIPANRLVLSASSTLFYSLLKESPTSPIMISLPDINHDHLNSLLAFLHTGQVKVTEDDFAQVHATALCLEMRCFSEEETGSGENILPTFFDDDSVRNAESKERVEAIVSEEKYLKMRKELVGKSLKKVSEEEGRASWKCDICGKKWDAKVSRDKRKQAVRHMDLHLLARVRCSLCGISSNSLDSHYSHKSMYCKVKPVKDTVKKEVDGGVENVDEDELIGGVVVSENPDESISVVKLPEASCVTNNNYDDGPDDVKNYEEDVAKVDNDWFCLICGKFWQAKGKCKRHMKTHFPSKLACEICGKMISSKYKLQKHVYTCHRESICRSVGEIKFQSGLKENDQAILMNVEEDGQLNHDDEEDGQVKHDNVGDGQDKLSNEEAGVQAKSNVKEDGQARKIIDEYNNNSCAAVTAENKL